MESISNRAESDSSPWPDIAPLLDMAMAQLGEKDHSAVVLRFFEGKDLKYIGAALGVSENAAKTRVSRAVEKLRKFFVGHGITLSSAVIAGAVSANSVQAAPAGLASSVVSVAVAKGMGAGASVLALIKSTLELMLWAKFKTGAATAVVAALVVGAAMIAIKEVLTITEIPQAVYIDGIATVAAFGTNGLVIGQQKSTMIATKEVLTTIETPQVAHVEGVTIVRTFGSNGVVIKQQEPKRFSLSISANQWAVRLYADTNKPNGVSDVTCDGTNIYVFVPDAAGTLGNVHFYQSGSVYPGQIKTFPQAMGPIWWAFCSRKLTGERDGTILNFMNLVGITAPPPYPIKSGALAIKFAEASTRVKRIGSAESWLYPPGTFPLVQGQESGCLAHLTPLEIATIDGVAVVKRFSVILYNTGPIPTTTQRQKRCEYLISVESFAINGIPVVAVPQISQPALITDYRQPSSSEYVADHWLDEKERKLTTLIPVANEQ